METQVNVLVAVDQADLGRAGKLSAALFALNTKEASFLRRMVLDKVKGYREGLQRQAEASAHSRDVSARFKVFVAYFKAMCDGTVAEVALSDDGRAAQLPLKSAFEKADPSVYAQELILVLEQGSAREKANAAVLGKAAVRIRLQEKAVRAASDEKERLTHAAKSTKLELDKLLKEVELFIHENAPKGHEAIKILKHRAPKKKKDVPTPAPGAANEQPAAQAPAPAVA